jgi:sugar phosphate isomerase/epimerase
MLQVRRDVIQVISISQRCDISALFANKAGNFIGASTWDSESIMADLDPRAIGHMYDPAEAMIEGGLGGWEAALRLVLPRLKAVSLQDFYWEKTASGWAVKKCPLGEGMVDWNKFFGYLAAAKFTGPISIAMEYAAKDEPGSMAKDLEFTRKGLQQAWASAPRS